MPRSLVLGANGFIGSHLVDALVENGHQVVAFGRSGSETKFNHNPAVVSFYGDFLNRADLAASLKDIDYVYHFISTTNPASAENDPVIDIETNIRMSVELFELCIEAKVKRVIFASTGGSVYGDNPNPPYSETDATLPFSPYAIGKLTIEHYLRYFRHKYGLDSVTFRISNPYGERQPFHRKQGVIPIFIESIYREVPITLYGDGSMVRDYMYVGDVASMIAETGTASVQHDTYNLGSGEGIPLTNILAMAEKVVGKKATVNYLDTPSTFVKTTILDTNRFKREFSLNPTTGLEEGMRLTFEYIKEQVDNESV